MTIQEIEALLSELRKKYKNTVDAAQTIMATAQTEKRSLKEDERAEFDRLVSEADSTMVEIEDRAKLLDLEKRGQTPSAPGEPNQDRSNQAALNRPAGGFQCFGEMLQSVRNYELAGTMDQRLVPTTGVENRNGFVSEIRTPSGQNISLGSDGGFLVRPEYMQPLIDKAFESGQIASRCNQITVSARRIIWNAIDSNSRATGSRWGGVQVYFEGEAESPTAKKVGFKNFEVNLRKILGLCYATEESLEDAVGLGSYIQLAFSNEIGFVIDDRLLNGTGGKDWVGILNQPSLVTVAKETGQTAATVVKENVDKMWNACWAGGRGNSAWFVNQEVEPQFDSMAMPVGTGGAPVYLPVGGISASPFSSLKGRPVVPVEQCQALGTKGDIILANMKEYILARRGGISTQMSMHVKFVEGETAFRFVCYVGGNTPWVTSLTPYKGSGTYSPFVALATRA